MRKKSAKPAKLITVICMIYSYFIMIVSLIKSLQFSVRHYDMLYSLAQEINRVYWYVIFTSNSIYLASTIVLIPIIMFLYFVSGNKFKIWKLLLFLIPEILNLHFLWGWIMSV
ncbi:MAG: hypothetical protein LIO87_11415 [Eubacterium sp.]|nr:hypothetical protein [Eubacterium sp.]